jgi:hypothetical protein
VNAGGGSISRWQVSADAGSSKTSPRSRHEVGHATVSGQKPPRSLASASEAGGREANATGIGVVGIKETPYYYRFPREDGRCLRTNNPLARLLREMR